MIIAIGADHRGYLLKEQLKQQLITHKFIDVGAYNDIRSDYPPFAKKVAQLVQSETAARGLLICGSGTGMAIAANRFVGIYAAVVWSEAVAKQSRTDDNCNILVLPADYLNGLSVVTLVKIFLETEFSGGRYGERVAMIDLP